METTDELLPEYDLHTLRIRKFGPGRKHFGKTIVQLDNDVAEVFKDAETVNEALRSLIKIARDNKSLVKLLEDISV